MEKFDVDKNLCRLNDVEKENAHLKSAVQQVEAQGRMHAAEIRTQQNRFFVDYFIHSSSHSSIASYLRTAPAAMLPHSLT
jgi:exonuclease I